MFSATDDDDFFNVTANTTGSNLASLFGTSLTVKQSEGASLVYTAPKNPKLNTEETPKTKSTLQSSVICTAFVDTFTILSDKNQTPHGKCGLAVIGNQSLKTYEVILYKSKQDIIMRTKLKSEFTFIVLDNNYASFYDDQKQQWSVHFDGIKEINIFVEEIKKCGAKIVQNLNKTNTVETKLSTDNITSKDSDVTSDSSNSKTKANILSRMARMGQPILPASLPVKSDSVPRATDSETDEPEIVRKPVVKKRHKIATNGGENATKSNNQSSTTPEYVFVNGQLLPVSSIQSTVSMMPNSLHSQLLLPNQLPMNPHPQLTSFADPLNIFIAENRTHNCELRMNMTQLSSKLDNILAKIDKSSANAPNENTNELHIKLAERDEELAETRQSLEDLQKRYDLLNENSSKYQGAIHEFQQQTHDLKQEIFQQNERIETLTASLKEQTLISTDQQQTIVSLNETVDNLKAEATHTNNFSSKIETLNSSVKILQDEISDKNIKVDLFSKKLKQSMNTLYQEIMENFEEETSYLGTQIKTVLSQKLKKSTLGIIQEFNKDFKDISENKEIGDRDNCKIPPDPEL